MDTEHSTLLSVNNEEKQKNKCCGGLTGVYICLAGICVLICTLLLAGIITGSIIGGCYHYCHRNHYSTTVKYPLKTSQVYLQFENYGNFEIIQSEEYFVEVRTFFKEKGANVSYSHTETSATFSHYGYYAFNQICEGYDVKLYKPSDFSISIDVSNNYGKISMTNQSLEDFRVTQMRGSIEMTNIEVAESIHIESTSSVIGLKNVGIKNQLYIDNHKGLQSVYNGGYRKNVYRNISLSNVSALGRAHLTADVVKVDGFHGWDLFLSNTLISEIDCQSGEIGDLIINNVATVKNCSIHGALVVSPNGFYSPVQVSFSDITRQHWGDFTFQSGTGVCSLHTKNMKFFNYDLFSFTNCEIELNITPEDFGETRMDFDLRMGEHSKFTVQDLTTKGGYVEKTFQSKTTLRGTINKDGNDDGKFINVSGDDSTVLVKIVDA